MVFLQRLPCCCLVISAFSTQCLHWKDGTKTKEFSRFCESFPWKGLGGSLLRVTSSWSSQPAPLEMVRLVVHFAEETRALLEGQSWANILPLCWLYSETSPGMGTSMDPHPASVKIETRLQFSSNYYQIQSNTLLFTAAFSFRKAIILEKSALLWAHMHSRKPEHSQLLMGSSQNWTKNVGKELLILILPLFWGTSNWHSPVQGSRDLSCPARDHFQMPSAHSMFSTILPHIESRGGMWKPGTSLPCPLTASPLCHLTCMHQTCCHHP